LGFLSDPLLDVLGQIGLDELTDLMSELPVAITDREYMDFLIVHEIRQLYITVLVYLRHFLLSLPRFRFHTELRNNWVFLQVI
jgi:hypothetical protein